MFTKCSTYNLCRSKYPLLTVCFMVMKCPSSTRISCTFKYGSVKYSVLVTCSLNTSHSQSNTSCSYGHSDLPKITRICTKYRCTSQIFNLWTLLQTSSRLGYYINIDRQRNPTGGIMCVGWQEWRWQPFASRKLRGATPHLICPLYWLSFLFFLLWFATLVAHYGFYFSCSKLLIIVTKGYFHSYLQLLNRNC